MLKFDCSNDSVILAIIIRKDLFVFRFNCEEFNSTKVPSITQVY